MRQLTKLSLFSGILGDDLASEWAGIKTVCCVEIDPFCQLVIKKHHPDMPIIGDIHDVTKEKVKEVSGYEWVDIISGGDPCQPRSIAGKRRGKADDRDLWKDMFRVVCEFKPTWIVNENPTGRLTMDFHEVLSDLESQEYETRSFVIPACAVNAPHRRERLFIIAYSEHNSNRGGRGQDNKKNGIQSGIRQTLCTRMPSRTSERAVADNESFGLQRSNRRESHQEITQEAFGGCYSSPGDVNQESKHRLGIGKQVRVPFAANTKSRQPWEQTKPKGWEDISRGSWEIPWIEVATALCGMDDGFPYRVARLKALGNACVPQQVYPIYKAIVEVEATRKADSG